MRFLDAIKSVIAVLSVLAVYLLIWVFTNDGIPVYGEKIYESSRCRCTLILDAGHGGADGGAVSVTGSKESEINLAIAEKAEQFAALYGIDTVMTRRTENIEYPADADTIRKKKAYDQHSRVELINSIPDAVLISIHQNTYTTSVPSGAQVYYADTSGSQTLGEYIHGELIKNVNSGNRETAKKIPDTIYLMNSIDCPAVLVECGFLSNSDEAMLLENDTYQTKLAAVIIGAFLGCAENPADGAV